MKAAVIYHKKRIQTGACTSRHPENNKFQNM